MFLHLTTTALLFLLVLLLLLVGSGLSLPCLQWLVHFFGGFVGFAVIIDRYLCLVFFGNCHNLFLACILLLVRVPFIETRAVLLFVHTDVGIEGVSLLIHHILQIERATTVQGFALLVGKFQSTELTGCALLLCLLLAFLEPTVAIEDELNALSLGIDLQGGAKGLAALGSHALHLYGFALHEILVLLVGKRNALDFLGDVHPVGTQGDKFVGLRVNGNVGGKRLTVLGCYLDGLAEVARSE